MINSPIAMITAPPNGPLCFQGVECEDEPLETIDGPKLADFLGINAKPVRREGLDERKSPGSTYSHGIEHGGLEGEAMIRF